MNSEVIAVVGMACRFPGAKNLRHFWDLLASGNDAVTEIPDDRWSKSYFFHPKPGQPGKSYTWAAGVIDNVDQFDAAFFGISPREMRQMDPQQRLLLETTWEALEDAGIPAAKLAGSGTGAYVGVSSMDYATLRLGDAASGDAYFMTGMTNSIVANRISYNFNLHGPSFAVDTACSSSLVALDVACRALRNGEIPAAVVGGVNLLLAPFSFLGFCQAAMLSPTGRCHAFDSRADGYVRAEGVGVVILKTLRDALANGDPIRAVILGTGVNSDGHTMGLSLPNEASQTALLDSVYAENNIDPERIAFIEAHGTGTQVGDPIELSALGKSLARRRTTPLWVGSVKTNVGHLETASGMAGLIKSILALEHRALPASLNFEIPNPNIPFADLNIVVAAQHKSLPATGQLLAGVNSFGFGGTNAHAIVASAPVTLLPDAKPVATLPPLLLSARSAAALDALAREWSERIAKVGLDEIAPLVRAAATRRDHHRHRLCVVGEDATTLSANLTAAIENTNQAVSGLAASTGKLAFVYSGNGAQFLGMGRDALKHSTKFREALRDCDTVLRPMLGWSIEERLQEDSADKFGHADVAQPLLFGIQVATTEAMRAVGIDAHAYTGHSVGEIAAAWAAGALSLETAARIVVARSRHQHRTHGEGSMAVLSLDPETAKNEIEKIGSELEIAAINSRTNVTVAGERTALKRLETVAADNGWQYTPLDIEYGFHSAILDNIREDLLSDLTGVTGSDCGSQLISTVTAMPISGTALTADYWWQNIRLPVRFRDAVEHLVKDGVRIFVEVGPNPILLSYLRDGLRAADVDGRVLGTLSRTHAENDPFVRIAAQCYVAGYDLVDHADFTGPIDIAGLPHYPWQRERHWYQATTEAIPVPAPSLDHPLLGYRFEADRREWTHLIDLDRQPWLADHSIEGLAVLPAAVTLEIGLAVARASQPEADVLMLEEVEIRQAITLEPDHARSLRVRLDFDRGVVIDSRPRLSNEDYALHAIARIAPPRSARAPRLDVVPPGENLDPSEIYSRASRLGFNYGPKFRVLSRVILLNGDAAHVTFASPAAGANYLLSPTILDGGLQGFIAMLGADIKNTEFGLLPWRFAGVRVFAPFGRIATQARLVVTSRGTRSACGTITFYDVQGDAVADIDQCWFKRVRLTFGQNELERSFHFELTAAPRPGDDATPSFDLVRLIESLPVEPEGPTETGLLFEGYISAVVHRVLRNLMPGELGLTIEELVERRTIAIGAVPLAKNLLRQLAGYGAAIAEPGNRWRLKKTTDLPEPTQIWRTLLTENPSQAADLALAAMATEELSDFLFKGSTTTGLPASLTDQFFFASPSGSRTVAALRRAVVALAAQWPRGKPLRILEIGAGAGMLSRPLLDALAPWQGTLSYCATDADRDQVTRAAGRLQGIVGASTVVWDPCTGDATTMGGRRFDVVVAAYALSRQSLDETGLRTLSQVLTPNGLILIAEPQPNALWDWVFGRQSGWWQQTLEGAFSPLRSTASWSQLLASSGFSKSATADLRGDSWSAVLIVAQRDFGIGPEVSLAQRATVAIVVAEQGDPLATELTERLTAAGAIAEIIVPPEVGDGNQFCAVLSRLDTDVPDIVILPPTRSRIDNVVAATTASLIRVITIAQLAASSRERSRLWLVTKDAQETCAAPYTREDSALWGLGRTLANEMPQLNCRLVDLSSQLAATEAAERLTGELLAPDEEREIAFAPHGRYVVRLRRGVARAVTEHGPVQLEVTNPGRLDSLQWSGQAPLTPGRGEVAIAVDTADLNFRDIMWAMDLLPEEALLGGHAGPSFGLACAGIITAVGPEVSSFAPGDRVLASAPASLASNVVTAAHTVTHLPTNLDFVAAATLPVAFITVIYALGHLANVREGECVLIHGGAGGVGIAAIQYAKYRGAKVIASSGSVAKRAFLREYGADHVIDSRDLTFVETVRELTGGQGVDVVLNSLSGDAMEQSLSLVRPFGRFLELGKRDFFLGTRVTLRPLRKNISYFAVDVDTLTVERPDLSAMLMEQTIALINEGALRPLPYRRFGRAEIGDAFRLMQSSGHIGKIVIEMAAPRAELASRQFLRRFNVRSDRTYLIAGGLTGFGLATAKWLVARGARSLALIGRRGLDTPGAKEAIEQFRANQVNACAFACDVSSEAELTATLAAIRTDMPPLVGVIHAAMTIDDSLLLDLDHARMARVLDPKLGGAINLDKLTRQDPIELFILYSSATSVFGAPGQGSYVAANNALEGVARRRHAEGLPAFVVGWGPISDVGYLARNLETLEALARRLAANPMPSSEALAALPALWSSGEISVAYASVRWDAALRMLPTLTLPTFADFVGSQADATTGDLRDKLAALPFDERKELIYTVLVEEVTRILSTTTGELDPHRSVAELGMDSLMAVELRLALEGRLGINLPMLSLSQQTSLAIIAANVARGVSKSAEASPDFVAAAQRYESVDIDAIEPLNVRANDSTKSAPVP